ncbi:Hsp70 chaperone (BiP), partial [Blumeria hordei DH14]
FCSILFPETGVPVRRTIQIAAPSAGGDVLIAIAEGDSSIKVTKPEAKPKTNGGSTDGDEESEEDEDEDEELREKIWKASKIIGHAAIRGVQKAGKIEITLSISDDLKITITARELGAKSSIVRGMAQLEMSP